MLYRKIITVCSEIHTKSVKALFWRNATVFRGVRKKLQKATINFVLSVRPFAWEQLAFHWIKFHEIRYSGIFLKSVEIIRDSLKPDSNNGYFTQRPMYTFDSASLNSSQNQKCFRQDLQRKSEHILYSICFSPRKSRHL